MISIWVHNGDTGAYFSGNKEGFGMLPHETFHLQSITRISRRILTIDGRKRSLVLCWDMTE
jgi:hypothetical protein